MTITFTNVTIRSAHIGLTETKIHLSAGWTAKIREAMKWGDAPEGWDGGKLGGELIGQNMILTPTDEKLAGHELQVGIGNVGGFSLVVTEHDDAGQVSARELRFHSVSQEAGVAALVENYLRTIGEAPGKLKVAYTKQLALGEAVGVDTGNA
jgi:hypothetical protein